MKRKTWLILLGLSLVLFGGWLIWQWLHPSARMFFIDTVPTSVQVQLDGQPMGVTPLAIKIDDSQVHTLTLTAPDYLPAIYQLGPNSAAGEIVARLVPAWARNSFMMNFSSELTPNWEWLANPALVQIINTQTGEIVNLLQEGEEGFYSIAISPDGNWVAFSTWTPPAAAGMAKTLHFWLVERQRPEIRYPIFEQVQAHHLMKGGLSLYFSPDGQWLTLNSDDVRIIAVKPDNHAQLNLPPPKRYGQVAIWSPDSQWLAVDQVTQTQLYHWTGQTWEWFAELPTSGGDVLGFSNDSRYLLEGTNPLVSRQSETQLNIWDLNSRQTHAAFVSPLRGGAFWDFLQEPAGPRYVFRVEGWQPEANTRGQQLFIGTFVGPQYWALPANISGKPLYWLPDGQRLALLTKSEKTAALLIVDVPADGSPVWPTPAAPINTIAPPTP